MHGALCESAQVNVLMGNVNARQRRRGRPASVAATNKRGNPRCTASSLANRLCNVILKEVLGFFQCLCCTAKRPIDNFCLLGVLLLDLHKSCFYLCSPSQGLSTQSMGAWSRITPNWSYAGGYSCAKRIDRSEANLKLGQTAIQTRTPRPN